MCQTTAIRAPPLTASRPYRWGTMRRSTGCWPSTATAKTAPELQKSSVGAGKPYPLGAVAIGSRADMIRLPKQHDADGMTPRAGRSK